MDEGPTRAERIREKLAAINPDAVTFDGLEDALVGIGARHTMQPVALYSRSKILEVLLRDGGTYEEAVEHFEFNIACLWAGEGTPLIADFETDY